MKFSRRQLTLWCLAYGLPLAVFVMLAVMVNGPTPGFDAAILQALHSVASPALTQVVVMITTAGSTPVITLGMVALCAWPTTRHERVQVGLVVGGIASAVAVNLLLKQVFERTRPNLFPHLVMENSYSFPSGHATASSALAFSAIFMFWPTRWRWLVVGVATTYMVAVGASRVYLGVHFPSDVLAAWCASFICVLLARVIIQRLLKRPTA